MSLITLESGKDLAFELDNFDLRSLISVVCEDNKILVIIIVTGSNRIIDIAIN